MTNIKDYGYKTIMKFIDYDINTAYERVLKRELLTGRHTPVEIINERYDHNNIDLVIYLNRILETQN